MKLASLRSGGRDGELVLVDRALSRMARARHIAPSLALAIEDWARVRPELEDLAQQLEAGAAADVLPFDPDELASPLPRSHQFLDGSVYLAHMEKARRARGAAMPPNHTTDPVMYQGMSDRFVGPTEAMELPDDEHDIDYEAEIAVVTDDVPMGVSPQDAGRHIQLVMLLNDYTLRRLTATELPKGFGFLQSKPTSSFGPVAVTLDELGDDWDGERFHVVVRSSVDGILMGDPHAGHGMFFTYPQLIAHAAATRCLSAGTVIGAGSVSNEDPARGHGCIAEARIAEQLEDGKPHTAWLRFGSRLRIEAFDSRGNSVFGAIDQEVAKKESS